jgi:hypothetical protein
VTANEPPATGEWGALLTLPTRPVRDLARADVPEEPGVYLWRRSGAVVYVGTASNLRTRLWGKHLGGGVSLAASSLRRNVCELLYDIPPTVTSNPNRQKVAREQADAIRAWLLECELSWEPCASAAAAVALELRLLGEFRPPLNRS